MPFPFSKSKRNSTLSPTDTSNGSRPLMYAQSDYAPSIATVDSTATTLAPSRAQQASEDKEATSEEDQSTEVNVNGEPFQRPTTPPKGSRHNPWESYSNLPADHPVFVIPAAKREQMYAKGVDPVVKAEMDKAVFGKVYGQKTNHVQSFRGMTAGIMNQWGAMYKGGAF